MSSIPISYGWPARDICNLVNRRVVEEHASEAGFLWMQREIAVGAAHFRLSHLSRLDERLAAHLHGLALAAEVGWLSARKGLADCSPASVFTATWAAFAGGERDRMRHAIEVAMSAPGLLDAACAAVRWLGPVVVEILNRLGISIIAAHRLIACEARCANRSATETQLGAWTADSDVHVRRRALRAVGELKCRAMINALEAARSDDDKECRYWAAWSAGLLGDRNAARLAFDEGQGLPSLRRTATEFAMRFADEDWARSTIRELAANPSSRRQAIVAIGAFGDPAALGWLLQLCTEAEFARVAGEAISTITGVDLAYSDFDRDAVPPGVATVHTDDIDSTSIAGDEDSSVAGDPVDSRHEDSDLPWPERESLGRWIDERDIARMNGQRCLGGQPISFESAGVQLRHGYQRQRFAAALEVSRIDPASPLFPTALPGFAQRRRLAS